MKLIIVSEAYVEPRIV